MPPCMHFLARRFSGSIAFARRCSRKLCRESAVPFRRPPGIVQRRNATCLCLGRRPGCARNQKGTPDLATDVSDSALVQIRAGFNRKPMIKFWFHECSRTSAPFPSFEQLSSFVLSVERLNHAAVRASHRSSREHDSVKMPVFIPPGFQPFHGLRKFACAWRISHPSQLLFGISDGSGALPGMRSAVSGA